MTHLTTEVLAAWREHPAEADRETIVAHLAVCRECSARYAELLRSEPAALEPTRFDPAAFRARGLAARQTRRSRVRWVAPALAVAALIALVLLLPKLRPAQDESVVRGGSSLRAVAPVGVDVALADPIEFTWAAPLGSDTTYRIEITDAAGSVIHDAKVTGAQKLTLPADVQARLKPGAPYHWLVSRLNARGETVQSSPLATFTIRR